MIVFDLDNTLSDAEHRSHLARNKLWDDFHGKALEDEIVPAIQRLYQALWNDGEIIIILTGRPLKYMAITHEWLDKYNINCSALVMRPDNDYRQDFDFKAEALQSICKQQGVKPESVIVFEDRDTVCRALRPLGYTVLQVRESLY